MQYYHPISIVIKQTTIVTHFQGICLQISNTNSFRLSGSITMLCCHLYVIWNYSISASQKYRNLWWQWDWYKLQILHFQFIGLHKLSKYHFVYAPSQWETTLPLRWHHNGRGSVSNHQPHDCLLNPLFGRRSKITSKLHVTGFCAGNSPLTGEFPAQRASNVENFSIWWRHHDCNVASHWLVHTQNDPWLSLILIHDLWDAILFFMNSCKFK